MTPTLTKRQSRLSRAQKAILGDFLQMGTISAYHAEVFDRRSFVPLLIRGLVRQTFFGFEITERGAILMVVEEEHS